MVIDFEQGSLTEYEESVVLPAVIKILHKKVGVKKATTNRMIGNKLAAKGIISTLNLIANSGGYYVAKKWDEVEKYVRSLRGRARSIMDVAESYN